MAKLGIETKLEGAIEKGIGRLLALQYDEGYWWGELESNVTITAEHMFLTHILGVADKKEWKKIANYILSKQRDDGTWAIWYDGPQMRKAREFILSNGGVEKARIFTKIWLAMLGEWDWRGTPMMPPEVIFLPHWFSISIYDFACWARGTVVPMTIIQSLRPVFPLPKYAHIDELFVNGKKKADLPAPDRDQEGRTLDRRPPGGGRLVGRDPTPVGVLVDRAQGTRLPDGSPGDEEGIGRVLRGEGVRY